MPWSVSSSCTLISRMTFWPQDFAPSFPGIFSFFTYWGCANWSSWNSSCTGFQGFCTPVSQYSLYNIEEASKLRVLIRYVKLIGPTSKIISQYTGDSPHLKVGTLSLKFTTINLKLSGGNNYTITINILMPARVTIL